MLLLLLLITLLLQLHLSLNPLIPILSTFQTMNGRRKRTNGLILFNSQTMRIIMINLYRWRIIQIQLKVNPLSIQIPLKELLFQKQYILNLVLQHFLRKVSSNRWKLNIIKLHQLQMQLKKLWSRKRDYILSMHLPYPLFTSNLKITTMYNNEIILT